MPKLRRHEGVSTLNFFGKSNKRRPPNAGLFGQDVLQQNPESTVKSVPL